MESPAATSDVLDALEGDWRACVRGVSRTRVLLGPAGIGKTTLLRSLAGRIGGPVASVRCQGGALAPPGSAATALLAALGEDSERAGGADPMEVADRLERALLAASGEEPRAVLIDDLHEADPTSGIAFGLAARRDRAAGLLIVAASRPSHDVLRLVEGLHVVEVEPLGEEESGALLAASSPGPVDSAVAAKLLAAAQGLPLVLSRLPRMLTPEQLAGTEPLPEPLPLQGGIRAIFSGQLARLGNAARSVLEAAAVAESGDWASICRCLDVDVAAGLDELQRIGLASLDEGRFRPGHPLLLEAAWAGLDPAARRRLEARFAQDDDLPASSRLIHRARATAEPDPDLAQDLAAAAAEVSNSGGGDLAARLFDLAAQHAATAEDRWTFLLGAAESYGLSGDPATARARLNRIVEEAPMNPLGILASIPLAAMESLSGAPRRGAQRLAECAQEAPPELAVPIALAKPIPLGMLGDLPSVVGATAGVIDTLPNGSPERTAAAIVHAHGLFAVDEEAAVAVLPEQISDEVVAAGLALDPSFGLHVGRALGYAERYDDAETTLLRIAAGARTTRSRSSLAMTYGALADVRLRSCRFDEAQEVLDEAISISLGIGQRAFAPFWLGMRARIAAMRGDDHDPDLDLARRIAESLNLRGALFFTWAHAGNAALSHGDAVGAVEELEKCRRFEAASAVMSPQVSRWRFDLIDAYGRLGDPAAARVVLTELEDAAIPMTTRWSRASLHGMRGMVAAADDPGRALEHLDRALSTFDPRVDRLDYARTQAMIARTARRLGAAEVAERAGLLARSGFDDLGASRWRAQVRTATPTMPAMPAMPEGADTSLERLTAAERRVLDHVAQGLTNQQAATRLGVSARTVANHLYRIYAKLGVASRTEAALLLASSARPRR